MVPCQSCSAPAALDGLFSLSLGNWVLIYFIEVWEYGAVQIISHTAGLTGYRFPLCFAQFPVMEMEMVEIALVACAGSL